MKFSAAAVSLLAASATAKEFGLRSVKPDSAPADARVIVQGLVHELSEHDLELISQITVAAYNKAYGPDGHELESFEIKSALPVKEGLGQMPDCRLCGPDDEAILAATQAELLVGRYRRRWRPAIMPDCRLCGPDDDAAFVTLGDIHLEFETDLCAMLRDSGSANMANAKGCSFSVVETPGQPDAAPIQSKADATEAQITVQGTLRDLSAADLKIIDESAAAAYADAFGVAVKLHSTVAVGTSGSEQFVFARASKQQVIATDVAPKSDDEEATMHAAMEKAFCAKLQMSGSANLANAHDCHFHFVYNPVGKGELAQM